MGLNSGASYIDTSKKCVPIFADKRFYFAETSAATSTSLSSVQYMVPTKTYHAQKK